MSSSTPNEPLQDQTTGRNDSLTDDEAAASLATSQAYVQQDRQIDATNIEPNAPDASINSPRSSAYDFGVGNAGYTKVAQVDSEPQPSHSSLWSVGLMTPASIVCFFLLATLIAIAHYSYCCYLDEKFIEETIPQSWNAALSIAFARAFSTALAASASTAFTQVLWWYLRRKVLSLSNIDALFSISTSPMRLHEVRLLGTTPLLWFFAFLLPLISVVTIFPPGSLVIQQLPDEQEHRMTVPTLNLTDRRDGSVEAFFSQAIFVVDNEGVYMGPSIQSLSIGKRTLMNDAYLTRPSPCGANCSYDLTITAPSLRCEDISSSPMNMTDDGSVSDGDGRLNYRAMTDFETKMFNINYRSRNRTDEELSAHKPGDGSDIRNITCATQHTTYTAHVSYLNESQNVALKRIAEKPFDELAFRRSAKFWDMLGAKPSETGFEYSKEGIHNRTMDELWQIYRDAQIAAMRETLTRPMTGYVAALWGFYSAAEGVQSYNHSATLVIQQTPLVEYVRDELGYQYREIYFRLSPSIVDRLMQNVTISLLNTASSNTSTMVTTTVYRSAYVFKEPARLIVAYFGILGICLAFVVLGLKALMQNGTPALTGGFLQILCTTTYSESLMNQIAQEASTRGTTNLPKELLDLQVRFGLVNKSEGAQRFAAFGTVEETEELLKSRYHSDAAKL